jgi:hypothetical protein
VVAPRSVLASAQPHSCADVKGADRLWRPGKTSGRAATSRHTSGSEATDPASVGFLRRTAMSVMQSPPLQIRDYLIRIMHPGGYRHRVRSSVSRQPSDRTTPAPSPHTRTISVRETSHRPSADAAALAAHALFFSDKSLRLAADSALDKSNPSGHENLFSYN